jgi:hypothetical protein
MRHGTRAPEDSGPKSLPRPTERVRRWMDFRANDQIEEPRA